MNALVALTGRVALVAGGKSSPRQALTEAGAYVIDVSATLERSENQVEKTYYKPVGRFRRIRALRMRPASLPNASVTPRKTDLVFLFQGVWHTDSDRSRFSGAQFSDAVLIDYSVVLDKAIDTRDVAYWIRDSPNHYRLTNS